MLLDAPFETWILAGTEKLLNCSLKAGREKTVKMHWEKDGRFIGKISTRSLKEVDSNATILQLKFLNAQPTDAGTFVCVAKDKTGRSWNATSHVYIGGKESTCIFL